MEDKESSDLHVPGLKSMTLGMATIDGMTKE